MKTSDFDFELPENLIAQFPPQERGQSRLMVLDRDTKSREHFMVKDLPSLLDKGTLLVFNNTKVRKARLFGASAGSCAKTEFLLLTKLDANTWQVLTKHSKRKKDGSRYVFEDGTGAVVETDCAEIALNNAQGKTALRFDRPIDDEWLDRYGHIPLPPYIRRGDTVADAERYQTIYATQNGSAAAPTAGLHFTEEQLEELDRAGMEKVFITLHVGLGTFLPVRSENIEDHVMHEESYTIGEEAAAAIEKAKKEKRKILSVGTTSLRALESAWITDSPNEGRLRRGEGSTSIFLYPGAKFNVVDMLFTNFHTPKSTLLMLVSAFAGREFILESYAEAVNKAYRFFSYGDAMLIK